MAPTIGRQWRGGSEDYAALCDYCDVRYLRSQLKRQSNGRLACIGPGTNSCGAGLDEVALDKLNADKMRDRRRPTASQGGRFDKVKASVEDIFGATLVEYWDAAKGVVSTTQGKLVSWTGQKLGAVFLPFYPNPVARWLASDPEFSGRPSIEFPLLSSTEWISEYAFLPAGARPYIAVVSRNIEDLGGAKSGMVRFGYYDEAILARDVNPAPAFLPPGDYFAQYKSVAVPAGTVLPIPERAVGSVRHARLYELDATGPLTYRAGTVEVVSSVDSPTSGPWTRAGVDAALAVTFLVLANEPEPHQIREFQALARSYAGRLS